MPGKTPKGNGNEPLENSVRRSKDAEAKDSKAKSKKAAKDDDEEMTVVVAPSKTTSKHSPNQSQDADGDVSMDGERLSAAAGEPKSDPAIQTVAGTEVFFFFFLVLVKLTCPCIFCQYSLEIP